MTAKTADPSDYRAFDLNFGVLTEQWQDSRNGPRIVGLRECSEINQFVVDIAHIRAAL